MSRRILLVLLACLISVTLSGYAWAAVEGAWDISGVNTVKVKIKGTPTQTQKNNFTDTYTFGNNSSFQMLYISGMYSVNKNKFAVNLSDTDIVNYMTADLENEFSLAGYTAIVSNVVITKERFKGTENLKDGTIKGTVKIGVTMDIQVVELNAFVTVKANSMYVFLGTRQAPLAPLTVQSIESPPAKTLAGALCDGIIRSVSAAGILPQKQ